MAFYQMIFEVGHRRLFIQLAIIIVIHHCMKRSAPYDIDEHTYEDKERTTERPQTGTANLAGRKIFKLARPTDNSEPKAPAKISLNIQGLDPKNKQEQVVDNKQKPLPQAKQKTPPNNIFNFNALGNSQGIGLFSSENTFVNLFSKPPTDKKDTSSNQSSSLFPLKLATVASEGKQAKPTSLFSTSIAPTPFSNGSLFNFGSVGSSSLFGNKGSSLFGQNKPSVTAPADNNQDEGDSEELQKGQLMEADPAKSTANYEYESSCKLINSIKASKYKRDDGDLIENVIVSLLHDQKSLNDILVVKLSATKNAIFNGLLLPKKSQIKTINNKVNSLVIIAFSLSKDKKLERHRLKIMIDNQDENLAKKFHQDVASIINAKTPKKE